MSPFPMEVGGMVNGQKTKGHVQTEASKDFLKVTANMSAYILL